MAPKANKKDQKPASAPGKKSKPSLNQAIRAAGADGNIGKNEALKIADKYGVTGTKIVATLDKINTNRADHQKAAIGLGAAAANAYAKGQLANQRDAFWAKIGNSTFGTQNYSKIAAPGPIGSALNLMIGSATPMIKGQGGYSTQAPSIPRGQQVIGSYAGLPQLQTKPALVQNAGWAPAAPAAPAAPPATGPVANWENSVNNSNQALIDAINKQIAANTEQSKLYMGQIDQLLAGMQQQQQQPDGLSSIVPYSVMTSSVDPASGARLTQAIAPRRRPLNTDLSIAPAVESLAGTGLNAGF